MEKKENKRVVVLYKSFYGSTKQYAEWIVEETDGDCFELDKIKAEELQKYDVIVFGGGLYAAGINGMKTFQEIYDQIKEKRIIICAVGLSPVVEKVIHEVMEANVTAEMKGKVNFFLLRGAYDHQKQKFIHKMMMKALAAKIKSKKEEDRTEEDRGILECIQHPVNFMNKESIRPILDSIH
ncbi:flavodoxin domain-containing protein [Tindallia californiensis]|uniref:Flavodoxin domain-containing protein n=1 Tax=Tindallia californiensis TaxID=159292 RepID=A0A1H3J126_9FIRM|nr:flavodoxin domain-containing protein [Tindallia californiensis]SDY33128.1 Flavodoxin domain-containing protein [Tindallia californiensis]